MDGSSVLRAARFEEKSKVACVLDGKGHTYREILSVGVRAENKPTPEKPNRLGRKGRDLGP